jgi:signal transduction histidine kinase
MRTDWLTGYGPSNLEALLILIVMAVLLIVVWLGIRHRWRNEADRMESAIAEARQHSDQLRGELGQTERQRDQLQSEIAVAQQQDEQLRGELAETQRLHGQFQDELTASQHQGEQLQSELAKAQHECDQFQGALAIAQQHGEQLQCELTEAQSQHAETSRGLTATQRQIEQLQREVNEVRAKYDPIRIREIQDEFHTEIAHEFATDLDSFVQGCKTTADRLKADQVDLRVLQNALRAKADNMKQHCKNVVGLERLDRIPFTLQAVSLVGLIQEVVAELAETYADFLGVRLELARPPKLPKMWVNKEFIREVYRNIVRNAINASRSGDVVSIRVRLEDGDPPQAIVDVHNDGRLILPELQPQIFELHRRGVGLPYSRQIVRLHGGDLILVWSKPGEGTLFRIILPCGEPGEPPSPEEETDSAPSDKPSESLTADAHGDSAQPGDQDNASPPDAAPEGGTP